MQRGKHVPLPPTILYVETLESPIGSKVTFPSLPILAVLIRGALIVTGIEVTSLAGESFSSVSRESVTTGWTTPGWVSAISLTSRDVSTSVILEARVCSRIVVGP